MEKCGVFRAANLVGKKWSIAVLQEVQLSGNVGFGSICKRMGKISPKILSGRLKELETGGLIRKIIVSNKPLRTKYELTKKGKELQDIISGIRQWNKRYSDLKIECDKQECASCPLF